MEKVHKKRVWKFLAHVMLLLCCEVMRNLTSSNAFDIDKGLLIMLQNGNMSLATLSTLKVLNQLMLLDII